MIIVNQEKVQCHVSQSLYLSSVMKIVIIIIVFAASFMITQVVPNMGYPGQSSPPPPHVVANLVSIGRDHSMELKENVENGLD